MKSNRDKLIEDLEWLLHEGELMASRMVEHAPELPPPGRYNESQFMAIRRILTGQTLGICPRVVRQIVEELRK